MAIAIPKMMKSFFVICSGLVLLLRIADIIWLRVALSTMSTIQDYAAFLDLERGLLACIILGFIRLATASNTGTATELPNCLYACVSETGITNSDLPAWSNPINLEHSLGVSLRGRFFRLLRSLKPFLSLQPLSTSISDPSL